MSEWLRSLTRNQVVSGRAGSNPAAVEVFLQFASFLFETSQKRQLN